MRFVVTGANGYIGSNFIRRILMYGHQVIAIDFMECHLPMHENMVYIQTDFEALRNHPPEVLTKMPLDALYHFAWAGVGATNRNDYMLQSKNIMLTLDVLMLSRQIAVSKVIIPGSASEYAAGAQPITGIGAPAPIDAYGAMKAACHVICDSFARQYEIPLLWAVISSVYGPGRDDNNVLSYVIKTLLTRQRPSLTRLEQIWDFIYIDDLVEAMYLLAQNGTPRKTYAIASGEPRSLSSYIYAIRDAIDPDLPLGIGEIPYKNGVPDNCVLDIKELMRDTGFAPAVSFEDGIARTILFFKG